MKNDEEAMKTVVISLGRVASSQHLASSLEAAVAQGPRTWAGALILPELGQKGLFLKG